LDRDYRSELQTITTSHESSSPQTDVLQADPETCADVFHGRATGAVLIHAVSVGAPWSATVAVADPCPATSWHKSGAVILIEAKDSWITNQLHRSFAAWGPLRMTTSEI